MFSIRRTKQCQAEGSVKIVTCMCGLKGIIFFKTRCFDFYYRKLNATVLSNLMDNANFKNSAIQTKNISIRKITTFSGHKSSCAIELRFKKVRSTIEFCDSLYADLHREISCISYKCKYNIYIYSSRKSILTYLYTYSNFINKMFDELNLIYWLSSRRKIFVLLQFIISKSYKNGFLLVYWFTPASKDFQKPVSQHSIDLAAN